MHVQLLPRFLVGNKLVWTGTQTSVSGIQYFTAVVPIGKTLAYTVKVTDSAKRCSSTVLYFQVAQGTSGEYIVMGCSVSMRNDYFRTHFQASICGNSTALEAVCICLFLFMCISVSRTL